MLLKLKNVVKKFPGVVALRGVNFELERGEVHCLVGENGAGKSTIVKILSGVYPDYEGEILIDSQPAHLSSPREARQLGIASIQQERDLVPTLNSLENIFLGNEWRTRYRLLDKKSMLNYATELANRLGVNIDLTKPVELLNVPDQEIVAIAKALSTECKILLVDEATAPLDSEERIKLFEVTRKLKQEGKGIVYISHNLEEIFQIGDKVTVLRDGRVISTKDVSKTNLEEIIHLMVGRIKRFHKQEAELGEKVFSVKDFRIDGFIEKVNFDVKRGEILGITGLAGCGKIEVLEGIFGLLPNAEGKINLQGKYVKITSPLSAIKKGIGLLPNNRREKGLVTCRPVSENIGLTFINSSNTVRISPKTIMRVAKEFIRLLRIVVSSPKQRVEYLSGGNQQKVVFAKSLAAKCNVLMLNEPTEGIDVRVRRELYDTLNNLAREGKSIVITSSDVEEILNMCDRILVMVNGRVAGEFTTSQTNKKEILEYMSKSKGNGN